ncbi:OmpG porin family protein [Aurantimonas sp. Leaf443]|uniref:OmpG porin family protein n=1 Tax=Aurantimonas sp. Leaf443 TaxID=1736378 RepID=UPI00329A1DF8
MFGAYLAGSIDSNTDDSIYGRDFGDFFLDEGDQTDTAVAVKGGVLIKPFDGAKLKVEGSYAFDPSQYSTLGLYRGVVAPEFNGIDLTNVTGTLPVEWQAGAGYAQTFGKLGVAVSGVYGETFDYFGISNGVSTNFGSGEYYKLVGNVGYEITDNFDVLGEISYSNVDFDDAEIDQTGGFIQFVRSF